MKAIEHVYNSVLVGNYRQAYVTKEDALKAVGIAYQEAVLKWCRWCFCHENPFERIICKIWGGTLSYGKGRYMCYDNTFTQHLILKWQKFEGQQNAMLEFYCDLDTENQQKLVDYVFSK